MVGQKVAQFLPRAGFRYDRRVRRHRGAKIRGRARGVKIRTPSALAVKFLYGLQTGGGVVAVLGNL